MNKSPDQTTETPRQPRDEIDWRASLKTPEAKRAAIVSRSLFSGEIPSATDVDFYLQWFADVGIPATDAMIAEAERRGMSIYDPKF